MLKEDQVIKILTYAADILHDKKKVLKDTQTKIVVKTSE